MHTTGWSACSRHRFLRSASWFGRPAAPALSRMTRGGGHPRGAAGRSGFAELTLHPTRAGNRAHARRPSVPRLQSDAAGAPDLRATAHASGGRHAARDRRDRCPAAPCRGRPVTPRGCAAVPAGGRCTEARATGRATTSAGRRCADARATRRTTTSSASRRSATPPEGRSGTTCATGSPTTAASRRPAAAHATSRRSGRASARSGRASTRRGSAETSARGRRSATDAGSAARARGAVASRRGPGRTSAYRARSHRGSFRRVRVP